MELILFAFIFVEKASFKLHNVINGCEHEEHRMPQRQQEIAAVLCWSSRFKRIYASDQKEIQKCNIRVCFALATSINSHRLSQLVATCGLSAKSFAGHYCDVNLVTPK